MTTKRYLVLIGLLSAPYTALADPMRPPNWHAEKSPFEEQTEHSGPILNAILERSPKPLANISGQWFQAGDLTPYGQVIAITTTRVTLQQGRKQAILQYAAQSIRQ